MLEPGTMARRRNFLCAYPASAPVKELPKCNVGAMLSSAAVCYNVSHIVEGVYQAVRESIVTSFSKFDRESIRRVPAAAHRVQREHPPALRYATANRYW